MGEKIVRLERLAFGGAAVGRDENGKTCFVSFGAPGDVARVRLRTVKKSYDEGDIVSLVESSPLRRTPPCPYGGECGGCQWMHLPEELQLEWKETIFRDTLWRMARVDPERILPVAAAPSSLGYRTRVQMKVRRVGDRVVCGFYRTGTHRVVDCVSGCLLADEPLREAMDAFRSFLGAFREADRIPQVDLASGENGDVVAVVHYIGDSPRTAASSLASAPCLAKVSGIHLQTGRKGTLVPVRGKGELSYSVQGSGNDLLLSFGAGSFSQINREQNRVLVQTVLDFARLTCNERVLDLFCGNGNISLPLATHAAEVTGVEYYEPSVKEAVANAAANGIENVSFLHGDAAAASAAGHYDLVVLDPPREGAREAVPLLLKLNPRALIYVSCDPVTLGRDLATLQRGGYHVEASRPIDMFPQTYHTESVTLLYR